MTEQRQALQGDPSPTPDSPTILIVGAGMSGICLAVQLKRAGITSFKIVEELPDVGGTWLQNTYPGAACDIPAFLYSYSFAPNYNWSQHFAPQSEILDYFRHCVDKFDIRSHIEFGVSITRAEFDEEALLWRVRDSKGYERTANVFISAVGQLNRPNIPGVEGLESFQGRAFHSARWRHDCDLRGRRVGVIGVGASAIQLIPKIAPEVERLVIFQRTANWIYPLHNFAYPAWILRLFQSARWLERVYRWWLLLLCDARSLLFGKESWLNRAFTGVLWLSMRLRFAPKLRNKLIPPHAAGCKRTLLSSEYNRTLNRQNVQLVDQPIRHIERDGIRTGDDAFHPVDTIILATGFETTRFLFPMEIVGRNRVLLSEAWIPRPRTYWGIMAPEFPNFFILYGPNTNLGHNSIILMVESQVRFIMSCLREMGGGATAPLSSRAKQRSKSSIGCYERGLMARSSPVIAGVGTRRPTAVSSTIGVRRRWSTAGGQESRNSRTFTFSTRNHVPAERERIDSRFPPNLLLMTNGFRRKRRHADSYASSSVMPRIARMVSWVL